MFGRTPEVAVLDEERPRAGVSGKRGDANRQAAPGEAALALRSSWREIGREL